MEFQLIMIIVILLGIAWEVGDIRKRLKERLPTQKEQDYELSQKDPWDIGKRIRMAVS
jgi:hypothetical protein